jgi:hypothetical protein
MSEPVPPYKRDPASARGTKWEARSGVRHTGRDVTALRESCRQRVDACCPDPRAGGHPNRQPTCVQIVAPVRQGALLVWNGRIVLPSLNPGVDSAVADVNYAPDAHDESLARNALRLPCTTLGRRKHARRAAAVQFQVLGLDALRPDTARHFFEPAELAEHSPFTRTQRNRAVLYSTQVTSCSLTTRVWVASICDWCGELSRSIAVRGRGPFLHRRRSCSTSILNTGTSMASHANARSRASLVAACCLCEGSTIRQPACFGTASRTCI